MGNFLNLSSLLMGANLLKIVRVEIKRLSDELNQCFSGKRDPLFHTELGFNEDGKISTFQRSHRHFALKTLYFNK